MAHLQTPLRFVVALMAEARPLIEHFRLQHEAGATAFRIFRRDEIWLVVCGPGKVPAAAATAYLHLVSGAKPMAVWLNLGIAGHQHRTAGESVWAHKIMDAGSGESWYPSPVVDIPLPGDVLITVDQPELEFPQAAAYDMEASGFWSTASRFSSGELIHCLKVISDGPGDDLGQLHRQRITSLVADKLLEPAQQVAGACGELAWELRRLGQAPEDLEACLERYHFTVSDRRELERLLRRRQNLAPEEQLPLADLPAGVRGRKVNQHLRRWLDSLTPKVSK